MTAAFAPKCIDSSVAEVTDEQSVAQRAEIGGRLSNSPWRVEIPVRSHASNQFAVSIEHIDEAVTGAGHVVVLHLILHSVGHDQIAPDVGDPERREAIGNLRVPEIAGPKLPV